MRPLLKCTHISRLFTVNQSFHRHTKGSRIKTLEGYNSKKHPPSLNSRSRDRVFVVCELLNTRTAARSRSGWCKIHIFTRAVIN